MTERTGTETCDALIVAAGRGRRAGGDPPKQWRLIAGQSLLERSLAAFRSHPAIRRVVLVLHPDDFSRAAGLAGLADTRLTAGGDSRADSVRAGLEAMAADPPGRVLIHDAARPLVPGELIDRVLAALDHHSGAAPALALTDALWQGVDGRVAASRARAGLYRAQTPQGFRFAPILAAHRERAGAGAADDVETARAAGLEVAIVAGDERNFKITLPGDFARAEQMLEPPMQIRTGQGYDVHALIPGDRLTLCGVEIAHDAALLGHSDADVGMHALSDAIYGALGQGDIGQHFPPSEPQWRGAASHVFLSHAAGLARAGGWQIANLDVTLICEAPRIGPHVPAMRAQLARIAQIAPEQVSVKATTSEGLGFTGRGEGIAATALATLVKK